jgi:hypothetical protein
MGAANVVIGLLEELLLVLSREDVATTAENRPGNIDSHLANRTAEPGLLFLSCSPQSSALAASAYAS